ncbi:MAG: protein-L-isoaspartate O-methyltransferase, partial [Bacteroidales bacterium]|nr:protein-L-isoaspartate O-methyltransferase [Bacteroidales bacterium]
MKSLIIVILLFSGVLAYQQPDQYKLARDHMVDSQIAARGISHQATLQSMRKVPRHLFVPASIESEAYSDRPLPIGYKQTISQPLIVAHMTALARPAKGKKALEIGTGSGYQAAVLAEIVDTVYTIEIVPELAKESAARLKT